MRCVGFLAFASTLFLCDSLHADKPAPPRTRMEVVGKGKFVFIMLGRVTLEGKEGKKIRAMYPASGLYKNDGSNKPLWTIDWYCDVVTVASDGVHMVRHGDWPNRESQGISKNDLRQEGFSFFAKGKLLREYSIGELVNDSKKLRPTASHFFWLAGSQVLEGKLQFQAETLDGNLVRFDLTTGKILEKKKAD